MNRMNRTKTKQLALIALLIPCLANAAVRLPQLAPAETIVQVDVRALLNARPVTTLTAGKLVTWTTGVDGGGKGNGYLTMAAALAVGDKDPKALPDNPLIPASGSRPEMLLHYSNDDAAGNQACVVVVDKELVILTPTKKYRQMFLAWTSAEGGSQVEIALVYADGTSETRTVTIPDYFTDIPANKPAFCYVVRDLAKWGPTNKMRELNHHNIHALDVAPDASRELASIKITKKPGRSHLLFWAATGVLAGGVENPVKIRLPRIFSDGMILQRDQPVPIWGWADPGEEVRVEFAGQTKSAKADAAGRWTITLDPLPASATPRELHVSRITVHDVLVGDVFQVSGQSNAASSMDSCKRFPGTTDDIKNTLLPTVHIFAVPWNQFYSTPQEDVPATCAWDSLRPEKNASYSAIAFYFARSLHQHLNVPIGIVRASHAGGMAQIKMPKEALLS